MRISKGSYHNKLLRAMSSCKLRICVNIPKLLYFVVSAAKMTNLSDLKGFALTVTTRCKRINARVAHYLSERATSLVLETIDNKS